MSTQEADASTPYAQVLALHVAIADIAPSASQPPGRLEETELTELVASIEQVGVLQPVILRRNTRFNDARRYELIAGARRWAAARLAGLSTIPAVFRSGVEHQEAVLLALSENLQRLAPSPIAEANLLRSLLTCGMTQAQIARRLGKSAVYVSRALSLLSLPAPIQGQIEGGAFSRSQGLLLVTAQKEGALSEIAQALEGEGVSIVEGEARLQQRRLEAVQEEEAKIRAMTPPGSLLKLPASPTSGAGVTRPSVMVSALAGLDIPRARGKGRKPLHEAVCCVRGDALTLSCRHCGAEERVTVAADLADLLSDLEAFQRRHRVC
jgi:ParB family transcriptional regulator, chromosome partitioning protein